MNAIQTSDSRLADENIRQTEAELLAKSPESQEDLTLMETLLLVPGLSRKDVVTLILDMLFAGIDTVIIIFPFALSSVLWAIKK